MRTSFHVGRSDSRINRFTHRSVKRKVSWNGGKMLEWWGIRVNELRKKTIEKGLGKKP